MPQPVFDFGLCYKYFRHDIYVLAKKTAQAGMAPY